MLPGSPVSPWRAFQHWGDLERAEEWNRDEIFNRNFSYFCLPINT